jgi:transmembrane sensor
MKITEELIYKFFRQECTPEERSAVSEYFDQHPGELDKYMDEEEWQKFDASSKLHPAISQQMRDVIEQHIANEVPQRKFNFKVIAIAASIITILGIGLLIKLSSDNQGVKTVSLAKETNALQKQYNDTINNKGGKTVLVTLKDGSAISLSAYSEIIYHRPFTQKNRDIYLKGEATFKVAKDKSRPFTVYAGGLSTTALGTCFKITAFKDSVKTSVQLFTGKVVVKQLPDGHITGNKDTYLTPGHMLVLNKTNYAIAVSDFVQSQSVQASAGRVKGITTISNSVIKFQNQSLPEVISVLQKTYHIQIHTGQSNLSNRSFTGDIDTRTENPDAVLHTIATLNQLNLSKQKGTYILSQ